VRACPPGIVIVIAAPGDGDDGLPAAVWACVTATDLGEHLRHLMDHRGSTRGGGQ
jgi:hypothetical protein